MLKQETLLKDVWGGWYFWLKDARMKQEGIGMYVTHTKSEVRGLLKGSAGHGT